MSLLRAILCAVVLVMSLFAKSARAEFPELSAVIERARERGPQSVLAAGDVRVAGATRHAAGLPPLTNPYVEVFVDRSRETQGLATAQANLWLPIELAGQRGKRIAEVERLVGWKQTARAAAQATAVGEAVAAYGELLVAAAKGAQSIDGEKVAREEAAYVAGRFDAKDVTAVENALAQGEVARWQQASAEAQLAFVLAKARLSIAIGDPDLAEPALSPVKDLPRLRFADGDALARALLQTSPVLEAHAREARYFAAQREKWEADAYAPVSFVLSAGRSDAGDLRVGGGLAWTLPFLRKNQAEIARADADAMRATAARAVAAAAIAARAKGFHDAYDVAVRALQTIDAVAIPAAQAVVDASLAAWRAGKLDLSRVFLARRDLAAARERRLDVAAAGWRAYGDLAGLVGERP